MPGESRGAVVKDFESSPFLSVAVAMRASAWWSTLSSFYSPGWANDARGELRQRRGQRVFVAMCNDFSGEIGAR